MPAVSAEQAAREVVDGTYLLDVREPWEWERVHAVGAHHIPMDALNERQAEIPQDARILVICHSGGRSARVTEALVAAGYDAVNVDGGTTAYVAAGGDVATGA